MVPYTAVGRATVANKTVIVVILEKPFTSEFSGAALLVQHTSRTNLEIAELRSYSRYRSTRKETGRDSGREGTASASKSLRSPLTDYDVFLTADEERSRIGRESSPMTLTLLFVLIGATFAFEPIKASAESTGNSHIL